MSTLGEVYPQEQERLRELLGDYKSIGPAGSFGYTMIADVLRRADKAAIAGDLSAMLKIFLEMKGCQ